MLVSLIVPTLRSRSRFFDRFFASSDARTVALITMAVQAGANCALLDVGSPPMIIERLKIPGELLIMCSYTYP